MNIKSVLALASTAVAVAVMSPASAGAALKADPGRAAPEAASRPGAVEAPRGLKTRIKITSTQGVAVTCTAYRESDNASVGSATVRARASGEQKVVASNSFDPPAGNPDLYMKCTGGGKTVTIRKAQNKLKLNENQGIDVNCNGYGSSLQCTAETIKIERA